jgi:hypothetical protein
MSSCKLTLANAGMVRVLIGGRDSTDVFTERLVAELS